MIVAALMKLIISSFANEINSKARFADVEIM